jgi:hypothetical protein
VSQPSAQDIGLPKLKDLMDRDFWSRPEGRWAKVTLALLGAAFLVVGVFSLPAILAYILFVLQTTTQIILNLAFIAGAYFVLTSSLVHAMFRATIRKIRGIFVNMAPVAIARDYIAYSRKKLASGMEAAKRFKAKMGNHMLIIRKFKANLESQEALAKSLLSGKHKDLEAAEEAQKRAERIRRRIQALEAIYSKMETLARALDTILKKAKLKVDSAEAELEDQITMFNVALDAKSAMADVKEAIGANNSTRKEMADMAAARMALEVAEVVVEIDEMIQLSEDLFSGVDAEEAVMSERAKKRFAQWEQESYSSVLAPGEKASIIQDALDTNKPYDLDQNFVSGEVVSSRKKNFNANDFFSS